MNSRTEPIRFGFPFRPWQRECADLIAGQRFAVLVLHRRAGKTELALKRLLSSCAKSTRDLPLYFYLAPQLKQAKTIAWTRLKQMVAPLIGNAVDINESELSVRFRHNGGIVRLYGADNPDAMRGVRLDGAALDEVGQMRPEVWEDIIRPALSDREGYALFIGTPHGINLFSAVYFGAQDRQGWVSARYTVYETDALPLAEIERLKQEMSPEAFSREFLCDFAAGGDDQLISLADIEEAARRVYKPGEMSYAPKILGVDPARFGGDRSVIYARQGLQAFDPRVYRGVDNMALAGFVAAWIDEWTPDATFIDAGAGSGVIDRLRQLGYDCVEVNFGGKATKPQYANKRTEMWWELADALRSGLAIPSRNSLKLELATPTYHYDASNRLMLESKDEIKKRMPDHASPDEADALALTYAFPVAPRPLFPHLARKARDYDPYRN